MKRAAALSSTNAPDDGRKAEQARVLDEATAVQRAGIDACDDDVLSDDELMEQAREEEERRAHFDAVLERSSADWAKVDDTAQLRDALISVPLFLPLALPHRLNQNIKPMALPNTTLSTMWI